MTLFERIDEARDRWNVLRHPFYLRWERGELTPAELSDYASEYRHAVVALAETAAVAGDELHAAEEAGHVGLWDEFSESVAATPTTDPMPETRACAEAWSASDPLDALAVLYAIESGQPEIAKTKLEGLTRHYGFAKAGPGTAYFAVHSTRDHEHAAQARAALAAQATPADENRLVAAAERALRGNWNLLDGVNAPAA